MNKLSGLGLIGRLSTKMAAAFIAIVVIFAGLGLLASRQLNQVRSAADVVANRSDAVAHLQEARADLADQIQARYELLIENSAAKVDEFKQAQQRRQQDLALAAQHSETAQERDWFNSLNAATAAFDSNFLNGMVPAWQRGDYTAAVAQEKISDQYLATINQLSHQIAQSFDNRNLAAQGQADAAAARADTYLLFAAVIGLGLSLIVIIVAVRRFSRPVAELKRASLAMTEGELGRRVHIDTHDEIADLGKAFNVMADSVAYKIRQLTNLSEIALAVSSESDWERVVNIVMEKGMELTGSEAAAIVLYDEHRRLFTDTYTKGLSAAFVSKMQFRPGGLAEEALLGSQAVFSDDIQASHRLSRVARREGLTAFICLPLKVRQHKLGVFYVYSKTVDAYGRDELSALSILSNQAAIAIQNAQILERTQEEAVSDGLTGLYNQKYFYSRLREEMERSSRNQKPLSIIFCDLDKFKAFNDLNGHALGDQALKDVARIINESKRTIDLAARYGGEEFALVLPETDSSGAQIIAHRIRRRVAGFVFKAKATGLGTLTTSIGVSSYPGDAAQIHELVDKADWSMYFGKRQGGNRVVVFHEEADGYGQDPVEELVREDMHLSALQALAQSVDKRGAFCQQHSESVARLAASIATEMELTEDEIRRIRVAGLLHDIGFISVPDEVVNKREHLTPEEWERIKQHPEVGATILKHIASLESFLPAIRHHHEHFDGQGYPDGLAREMIPLGARILAVADAYQAMICDRPYRKALTIEQAVAELRMSAGSQFDPAVVEAFINLLNAQEAAV